MAAASALSESALRPPAPRAPGLLYGAWLIGAVMLVGAAGGMAPVLAPATVVLAGLGWLCIARPIWAGYLLVTIVPITSGIGRGAVIPGLRLSEVLTVALGTIVLLSANHQRDARFRSVDYALFAYTVANAGFAIGSRLLTHETLTTKDYSVIGGPIQYVIYLRALTLVLQTSAQRRDALVAFVACSAPMSLLALAQGVVPAIDTLVKSLTDYSTQQYGGPDRANGLFPHFQVLAAYLFSVVVIGVALLLQARVSGTRRLIVAGSLVLAVAALMQTVTIAAIVGAFVSCMALVLWSERRWINLSYLIPALLVIGVVATPVLAARISQQSRVTIGTQGADRSSFLPQSVAYRIEVWENQSLPALRGHELLGTGPALPTSQEWRSTESMYFTLLFRGGLVLLAIYLALIAVVIRTAARARDAPDAVDSTAARALLIMGLVLLPMSIIQPYLTYGGISHAFWLLVALVATAPVLQRRSRPLLRARE